MSRASLLQETALWMDTVNLALCLFIYEVCNDCQFEFASGSDFVNFMNLKPTSRPVTVRPKENLRVCYMVLSVSQTIRPRERGKLWAEEFLKHCGISKSYYDKQKLLVESWRRTWGDDTLPFYYVQIAPCAYSQRESAYDVSRDMLPEFWELQYRLMDVPHCGMAATTDLVDEVGDIHPPYKHIVAHRLALWAMRDEYGRSGIECRGPELQSVSLSGNTLTLSFSHADGLKTSDGKAVRWLKVYPDYGKTISPEAAVSGNEITMTLPEGFNIKEIRYAWDEAAVTNLENGAGLPAKPFRYIFGCEADTQ